MLISNMTKNIELADLVYQMFKFHPVWKNRNHLVIYSKETVELETGTEREIIAEYSVNRAKLKKVINEKL